MTGGRTQSVALNVGVTWSCAILRRATAWPLSTSTGLMVFAARPLRRLPANGLVLLGRVYSVLWEWARWERIRYDACHGSIGLMKFDALHDGAKRARHSRPAGLPSSGYRCDPATPSRKWYEAPTLQSAARPRQRS